MERYYTTGQVGRMLGYTARHIRRLIDDGRLCAVRSGTGIRPQFRIAETMLIDFKLHLSPAIVRSPGGGNRAKGLSRLGGGRANSSTTSRMKSFDGRERSEGHRGRIIAPDGPDYESRPTASELTSRRAPKTGGARKPPLSPSTRSQESPRDHQPIGGGYHVTPLIDIDSANSKPRVEQSGPGSNATHWSGGPGPNHSTGGRL